MQLLTWQASRHTPLALVRQASTVTFSKRSDTGDGMGDAVDTDERRERRAAMGSAGP